jgi:hypothetical protein
MYICANSFAARRRGWWSDRCSCECGCCSAWYRCAFMFPANERCHPLALLALISNTFPSSFPSDFLLPVPIMASKGTPYSYKALSVPNCIRLISLQPALFPDEPLRCSLRHVHLSNCEALYEALSYTWGHPDLTHPLYVDDGDSYVLVTANLNRALRRLRHPVIVRSLWADAVCINQNSNEEKAYQIPLMTTIYRQAKMVVAWVDGGPEEEHGMQLLDSLSRLRRKIFDHQSRSLQEEFMNISTLHSISKFLNLPWFTRLWV